MVKSVHLILASAGRRSIEMKRTLGVRYIDHIFPWTEGSYVAQTRSDIEFSGIENRITLVIYDHLRAEELLL